MKTYIINKKAHFIGEPSYNQKRKLYHISLCSWSPFSLGYIDDFCDCVREDSNSNVYPVYYARKTCKTCLGKGISPIPRSELR